MLRAQPLLRDDGIFLGDLIPYAPNALDIGTSTSSFRTLYVGGFSTGTWTLTLPVNDGTPGQVLTTDGSGITSWTTVAAGGASIGGVVTGGTTGSVLFVGPGPVLAQDNANFFWDNTNNRLGLGIAIPTVTLDIAGNAKIADASYLDFGVNMRFFSDNSAFGADVISLRPTNGTATDVSITAPGELLIMANTALDGSGDWTPVISLQSNGGLLIGDGSGASPGVLSLDMSGGVVIPTGDVLIGAGATPTAGIKLDVIGDIRTSDATYISVAGNVQFYSSDADWGLGVVTIRRGDGTTNAIDITAPGTLYIEANAGLDGAGDWTPSLFLQDDGGVMLGNGSAAPPGVIMLVNDVGVQVGAGAMNANAALEVISQTKAFIPPRMTTVQRDAIAAPTAGMQVYDTTLNKISVYNGSAWRVVTDT